MKRSLALAAALLAGLAIAAASIQGLVPAKEARPARYFRELASGRRRGPSPLAALAGGRGPPSLESLASSLSLESIGALSPDEAGSAADELFARAKAAGKDLRELFASVLPEANYISASLFTDEDLADAVEAAATPGPAGESYRRTLACSATAALDRARYEALASSLSRAVLGMQVEPVPIARIGSKSAVMRPVEATLDYSHGNALDVFFRSVSREGRDQTGPELRSASQGVVVARAADWKGGGGLEEYRSGGLSPKSGNGVIIYDPSTRRFFSYFHLSTIAVELGEVVSPGQVIGKGGNTGANARKPGKGAHVHVEVYDCRRESPLRAEEVLHLLFD